MFNVKEGTCHHFWRDSWFSSHFLCTVPKRVGKAKKEDHSYAPDEGDAELLLNQKGSAPLRSQSTFISSAPAASSSSQTQTRLKITGNDSGSETEAEDDEEDLLLNKTPAPTSSGNKGKAPMLPTPARSVPPKGCGGADDDDDEDGDIDPGRAPGRIIGSTNPLKDFKKNLAQGDVVTKAVEDLGAVVTEIVLKPFAKRRSEEMVECLTELRKTCLEEDEIDAWNA